MKPFRCKLGIHSWEMSPTYGKNIPTSKKRCKYCFLSHKEWSDKFWHEGDSGGGGE